MDGTLALKKYNVVERIKALEEGGGAIEIKKKEYTGSGTSTHNIDFDDETPSYILCICIDPEIDNLNKEFHFTPGFIWGNKLIQVLWSGGSNNEPTLNGGTSFCKVTYENNVMTLTASNAGNSINVADVHYAIYYI